MQSFTSDCLSGPHSAIYTVKETETGTEFKKIRNSNIIEHAKEMFEKVYPIFYYIR